MQGRWQAERHNNSMSLKNTHLLPHSCRYMALVLHAAAEALNLRVVAPDRPGVGQSTFLPGRTVEQYAADVSELCEHLGKCGVKCLWKGEKVMNWLGCTASHAAVCSSKQTNLLPPPHANKNTRRCVHLQHHGLFSWHHVRTGMHPGC